MCVNGLKIPLPITGISNTAFQCLVFILLLVCVTNTNRYLVGNPRKINVKKCNGTYYFVGEMPKVFAIQNYYRNFI